MSGFLEKGQFAYQPAEKIPDWYFGHLLADQADVKLGELTEDQLEVVKARVSRLHEAAADAPSKTAATHTPEAGASADAEGADDVDDEDEDEAADKDDDSKPKRKRASTTKRKK